MGVAIEQLDVGCCPRFAWGSKATERASLQQFEFAAANSADSSLIPNAVTAVERHDMPCLLDILTPTSTLWSILLSAMNNLLSSIPYHGKES